VSLFQYLDTSETQRAWDTRGAELKILSSPYLDLIGAFVRAKQRSVDGMASAADPRHLAQLDITDGPWVHGEVRSKLDELDAATQQVRTLDQEIRTTDEKWRALVQESIAARDVLERAQAKAKADRKRNIKWVVIGFIVWLLYRACTS
jgi:hypothetical protein